MINPGLSKTLKTMKRDAVSQAITIPCSARRLNLKQAARINAISYPALHRIAAPRTTLGSLLDCYDLSLRAPRALRACETSSQNARKEPETDAPSVPFSPGQ
jgi:hypothetical protein